MKRGLVILFLATVFLQSGGWQLLFQVLQFSIHQEMTAAMVAKSSNTTCFMLSQEAFESARVGDDELSLNGSRYDICSIKEKGELIVVEVMLDEKETTFLATLDEWTKSDDRSSSAIQLLKLLSIVGEIPESGSSTLSIPGTILLFSSITESPVFVSIDASYPPPELS
jgi:hypothetical protein